MPLKSAVGAALRAGRCTATVYFNSQPD